MLGKRYIVSYFCLVRTTAKRNNMPNTYTQIHIQCIFAVKYRDAVISDSWKGRLHKYIIAIVNNNGHNF